MTSAPDCPTHPFVFERDTFTFANDLVWNYEAAAAAPKPAMPPGSLAPYNHRCFVMVRSARQFFYHARFEPELPGLEPPAYRRLIRDVVSRSARAGSPEAEKVVIPGYDCLRSFSRAHEPVLKTSCGSAWESYFVRSHWRMVFPIRRQHQERMARQLLQSIPMRRAAIVHLFRFPHITINHGVVLFGATESEREVRFDVYDPNLPDYPLQLTYDRATRTFVFPRTHYWTGGALNVYEKYIGGLY